MYAVKRDIVGKMSHRYAIKTLRRTHIKHHSFLDHGAEKFKLGLQPIRFSENALFIRIDDHV